MKIKTYEQALKALKDGKTVTVCIDGEIILFRQQHLDRFLYVLNLLKTKSTSVYGDFDFEGLSTWIEVIHQDDGLYTYNRERVVMAAKVALDACTVRSIRVQVIKSATSTSILKLSGDTKNVIMPNVLEEKEIIGYGESVETGLYFIDSDMVYHTVANIIFKIDSKGNFYTTFI